MSSFFGMSWHVLMAHAEDNASPIFRSWAEPVYVRRWVLRYGNPLIRWAFTEQMPMTLGLTYDAAVALTSTGWLTRALATGLIRFGGRAHDSSAHNAADACRALQSAGVTPTRFLASADDPRAYMNGQMSKVAPATTYTWDSYLTGAVPGHRGDSTICGVEDANGMTAIWGGQANSLESIGATLRAVQAKKIRAGVKVIMFSLGEKKDGSPGCSFDNGIPIWDGIATAKANAGSLWDLSVATSPEETIDAWRLATGGLAYRYDLAKLIRGCRGGW